MNALQCTLVVLPFLGLLAGCSGGDSTEPPPEAEGALAGSEDADRLATFGLASGAIATGEAAVALRQSLLDRGGKRAFSDDKTVVAGFIGRELAGFGRDDSRFFGITCQAAGTDVPGAGRLAVDTCSLSAVVEMAAQDGRKIGKLDTREKESAEYVAHLSGVLAAERRLVRRGRSRDVHGARAEGRPGQLRARVDRTASRDEASRDLEARARVLPRVAVRRCVGRSTHR
jgi:hypothetical protein